MPRIIVSPCSFFGHVGGIVSSVSSEFESGTSNSFAEDVPAAAVVATLVVIAAVVVVAIAAAADAAAAIAAFVNTAIGFVLFSR
jgi:hypothetical protein